MSFNFKKAAQAETALSPVMVGRTKLSTEEILDTDLTIVNFGFAPKFNESGSPIVDESTGEADVFGVVVFKELPDSYYSVGAVFTKVCKAWASGFSSVEEASSALEKSGGVRVRFKESKTKKGNNLTSVDILD